MNTTSATERIHTVVIGGGQAGLATGYHLAKHKLPFAILDANQHIGDSWRQRWDSLRLFSAARYDGLDGMPFPARANYYPTKDEMAAYLESYAARFHLPVRSNVRVDGLTRQGDSFLVSAGGNRILAENVVVAMAKYQQPKLPKFAAEVDPGILQMHSSEYRRPSQLKEGGVLIVGAGNSGAELSMEISRSHKTWLAGHSTGEVPFKIDSGLSHAVLSPLVLRFVFHKVMTVSTPLGRKVRPAILRHGAPLIRTKSKMMAAAGVIRVPRVKAIEAGKPVLEDGRVLDVANIIWCTGYRSGLDWIDLPVHGEVEPLHERGIVQTQPGLFFVGLEFQYAMSSTMIQGVSRDARRIVSAIAARQSEARAVGTSSEAVPARAV